MILAVGYVWFIIDDLDLTRANNCRIRSISVAANPASNTINVVKLSAGPGYRNDNGKRILA